MTTPLIISFFTENTIYEKEIEDLIESCRLLHLDFFIEKRKDLGCWKKNCCQKPLFIYECLKKYQRPLLWVDADAIILKKPSLRTSFDVSFYFNDWGLRNARAGTILATPSKNSFTFFQKWHLECHKTSDPLHGDQHFLPGTFPLVPNLLLGELPLSYVHVFDRDPIPFHKTHILHTQASRTSGMQDFIWRSLSSKDLKKLRMDLAPYKASLI